MERNSTSEKPFLSIWYFKAFFTASLAFIIFGGLLKETDLDAVKELLVSKVSRAYLIGDGANRMGQAWGDVVSCCVCGRLDRAVAAAWRDAQSGDTVLLSPGCASFDQFEDYKDRGNQYIEVVSHAIEER